MDEAVEAGQGPPEPYEICSQGEAATCLVYASPHSGRYYPKSFLAASKLGRSAIRRSEDAYVDMLLEPAAALGVPVIKGTYARAYIDLNRDPDELDESMFIGGLPLEGTRRTARVAAGLGAVARIVAEGQEIYREKIPASDALGRIANIHRPYHQALDGLLQRARESFGCSVLADWHSMPSAAVAPGAGVDVVIGDRFGSSCAPELIVLLEAELRDIGLRTQRNVPFAGGYTTEFYGQPFRGEHAVQIELNRALYLNEKTLELLPDGMRLQSEVAVLTGRVLSALSGAFCSFLKPRSGVKIAGE